MGEKVYGVVETKWQCVCVCVEGWDLSVSLSGILTALALVCKQTSYIHVSLFTAPPLNSCSSHSVHLSFRQDHTHIREIHNKYTCIHTQTRETPGKGNLNLRESSSQRDHNSRNVSLAHSKMSEWVNIASSPGKNAHTECLTLDWFS